VLGVCIHSGFVVHKILIKHVSFNTLLPYDNGPAGVLEPVIPGDEYIYDVCLFSHLLFSINRLIKSPSMLSMLLY
jgi:hypothetical protein